MAVVHTAGLDATDVADAVAATDVEYRFDPQHTCELLANALRSLHEVDPGQVDSEEVLGSEAVVERARERVESGVVVLDPAYAHMTPARLLEILEDGLVGVDDVPSKDLVPTHGHPGLASLRCRGGTQLGFVEWEHLAIADRHRDLAAVATAVAGSIGPMMVPVFFDHYGTRPDPRRLDWWALAAQLTDDPGGASG